MGVRVCMRSYVCSNNIILRSYAVSEKHITIHSFNPRIRVFQWTDCLVCFSHYADKFDALMLFLSFSFFSHSSSHHRTNSFLFKFFAAFQSKPILHTLHSPVALFLLFFFFTSKVHKSTMSVCARARRSKYKIASNTFRLNAGSLPRT